MNDEHVYDTDASRVTPATNLASLFVTEEHLGAISGCQLDQCMNEEREGRFEVDTVRSEDDVW